PGRDAAHRGIVEEEQTHRDAEQVEEIVVAGQQDQRLEQHQATTRESARTPRQENQKNGADLDQERRGRACREERWWQLRRVPRQRRRQRLRPEMIFERGKMAPGRTGRKQLRRAREEEVAEREPAIKPDDDPGPAREK